MLPYGTIVTSSPIILLQAISVPRACVLCIGSILQHRDRQTSPGSGNVPRVGISNARCNRGHGHRRRLVFTSATLGVAQGFQTMGMDGVKYSTWTFGTCSSFLESTEWKGHSPTIRHEKEPVRTTLYLAGGCLVINGQCEIGRALSSYGPAAGPWQAAPHPGRWLEDRWDGMDQHDTEKRSTQSCSRKDQSRMNNEILESS
ncbi:hypothetical protein FOYG_12162 [Fusarium oxysporum NRRL 32931]|uniref:Uncharacterized protein n=1 Tax=Fusarium oxysporum NRRL 32931 TaxID=660029 RepID=W9HUV1_FUSOX|nr:hypothetical protein FOYG_12162 [Fusarium oxysporum NRRL 32931]